MRLIIEKLYGLFGFENLKTVLITQFSQMQKIKTGYKYSCGSKQLIAFFRRNGNGEPLFLLADGGGDT